MTFDVNNTVYPGGFSSSICDLFSSKERKTDCCSLVCCGVFLSDKTRFLLDGQRPSWPRRVSVNIGIPLLYLLAVALIRSVVLSADTSKEHQDKWSRLSFWGFIMVVSVLLIRARQARLHQRLDVMKKVYEERYRGETRGHATLQSYMSSQHQDIRLAHSTCCCGCYPSGVVREANGISISHEEGDFCTWIWETLASICCLSCCGSWCQCFGMCAIGQEYREIASIDENRKVDYITFEPYENYFPLIEELRSQRVYSFWSHLRALSELSTTLLKMLGWALAVLLFVALVGVNGNFEAANMLVVGARLLKMGLRFSFSLSLTRLLCSFYPQLIATFGQAFLVLWLVHWLWHRLDLSLDAVIKYFTSGFALCTSLALVYELVLSLALRVVLQVIIVVDIGLEISKAGNTNPSSDEIKSHVKALAQHYPWIWFIGIFVNSFVVAALVEELSKYFSFWMVEHPDLDLSQGTIVTSSGREGLLSSSHISYCSVDTNESGHDGLPLPMDRETDCVEEIRTASSSSQTRSVDSIGVGITIAMVATALGFSCCENLLYVFIYTPPTVASEVVTLGVRSIFPVHPLAAAIQSIGVCERDLERKKHVGVGKIIFPAWLLHGAFDFILMVVAFLQSLDHRDDDNDISRPDDAAEKANGMISLMLAFAVVLLGAAYYLAMSRAQRNRLVGLEFMAR